MERKIRAIVPIGPRIIIAICLLMTNIIFLKWVDFLWIPKVFFALISILAIDWIWKSYIVDHMGIHQKWFFHTDHFKWDSFTDVFLICMNETPHVKNPQYCICFDRGLSRRVLPSWDRDFHWFKFVMFELEDAENINKLGNMRWTVNRTEILSFMRTLGVVMETKPYGGFIGDHG